MKGIISLVKEQGGVAAPSSKVSSGRNRTVAIIVVVIIAVAAVATIYFLGLGAPSRPSTSGSTVPGITQVIPLRNASSPLTLRNASYAVFPMPEPFGRLNPHVRGNFTTSGGAVEVVAMNSTSYTKFEQYFVNYPKDGHTEDLGGRNVTTYYDSNEITSGSFNVSLPAAAGTYYLFFLNRSYTNKVILSANVELVWQLPASS